METRACKKPLRDKRIQYVHRGMRLTGGCILRGRGSYAPSPAIPIKSRFRASYHADSDDQLGFDTIQTSREQKLWLEIHVDVGEGIAGSVDTNRLHLYRALCSGS